MNKLIKSQRVNKKPKKKTQRLKSLDKIHRKKVKYWTQGSQISSHRKIRHSENVWKV